MKFEMLMNRVEMANTSGLINEAVFDDKLKFAITNESHSVVAVANTDKGIGLPEIGVFDLGQLLKTMQYVSTWVDDLSKIEISIDVNRLMFSVGRKKMKFLLSDPKTISSVVTDRVPGFLEKVRKEEALSIILPNAIRNDFLKSIQLISPNTVNFYNDGKELYALVGSEMEHNAIMPLGEVKDIGKKVQALTDANLLSSVLQTVSGIPDIMLEVRNDTPLMFVMPDYLYIVSNK